MSAWVVSKAHIDAMVSAAIQLGGAWSNEPFTVSHGGKRTPVTRANASKIGQKLVDECVRSVSYRYPNDDVSKGELPGPCDAYYTRPYAYEPTRPFEFTEMVEMVDCYDYQSCEHPEWTQSWAHAFCRTLESRILHALPGAKGPWGFEEADVRAAATR